MTVDFFFAGGGADFFLINSFSTYANEMMFTITLYNVKLDNFPSLAS